MKKCNRHDALATGDLFSDMGAAIERLLEGIAQAFKDLGELFSGCTDGVILTRRIDLGNVLGVVFFANIQFLRAKMTPIDKPK